MSDVFDQMLQDQMNEAEPMEAVSEILDPTTGELVPATDADQLIDAYERIKRRDSELYAAKQAIIAAIVALAPGSDRTERVRGERRRVKIEAPDDSWDQPRLRMAWDEHPKLAEEVLRISTLAVKKREWDKINRESGPEEFELFKAILRAANKGPIGTPRLVIEL